jgi:3-keto-5-aminohexanoate cleavage enzyme
MKKLIITATCDCTVSFPANPHNPTPKGVDAVVQEYRRCVDAGACISHIHGVFRPKGGKSFEEGGAEEVEVDLDGWREMRQKIVAGYEERPIIQYGYAHAPFEQRLDLLLQEPDMTSINFCPHDECFNYDNDKGHRTISLYALHKREELQQYGEFCLKHHIKPEVESFTYGGIWNAQYIHEMGLLPKPIWTTFFLGWRGGCYTPPTTKGMQFMHDHLPEGFVYNTSVMDPPMAWPILTMAIILGGHVRVGMEDNPYVRPGEYAKSNGELVEKIVRIAKEVGREIASPDEARRIIGLS